LLLNRSGFKIIESSCIYGEYAAVASSLRFWLRAKFGKKRWVKFVEKVVFSYPARILLSPLLFLATKLPKGCSTPTVFATKSNKVNYNAL